MYAYIYIYINFAMAASAAASMASRCFGELSVHIESVYYIMLS